MPKFLAVYLGTASDETEAQQPIDEATEARGMKAWGQWGEANAASIVDQGSPLGRTKLVNNDGVSDTRNDLVGYVIVEASSLDEAAEKFLRHPHFSVFPGDRVEVIECMEMPG